MFIMAIVNITLKKIPANLTEKKWFTIQMLTRFMLQNDMINHLTVTQYRCTKNLINCKNVPEK